MEQVQAIRGIGNRGGFPYFAWGLYDPQPRKDGKLTYRLIASSKEFRSDKRCKRMFPGVAVKSNVRHGTEVQ